MKIVYTVLGVVFGVFGWGCTMEKRGLGKLGMLSFSTDPPHLEDQINPNLGLPALDFGEELPRRLFYGETQFGYLEIRNCVYCKPTLLSASSGRFGRAPPTSGRGLNRTWRRSSQKKDGTYFRLARCCPRMAAIHV